MILYIFFFKIIFLIKIEYLNLIFTPRYLPFKLSSFSPLLWIASFNLIFTGVCVCVCVRACVCVFKNILWMTLFSEDFFFCLKTTLHYLGTSICKCSLPHLIFKNKQNLSTEREKNEADKRKSKCTMEFLMGLKAHRCNA